MNANRGTIRKRRLENNIEALPNALDLATLATLVYTSEGSEDVIENILANQTGPGSPRWCAAEPDVGQEIILEFDQAQSFSRLVYEVEEMEVQRTQEIRLEASEDSGRSYRRLHIQEFTFSPAGATFQREDLNLREEHVTHLRLIITPNKAGHGTASITTFQLFQ